MRNGLLNDDDARKMAISESIEFLAATLRDKSLPTSDRLEAAAILLKFAPTAVAEFERTRDDLDHLSRMSADSN